jgi:hypothetical protein
MVSLVQSAGLAQTLSSDGPYTVFAPTDQAFKKVPAETFEALGNDRRALRRVLLYHVAGGRYPAARVVTKRAIRTPGLVLPGPLCQHSAHVDGRLPADLLTSDHVCAHCGTPSRSRRHYGSRLRSGSSLLPAPQPATFAAGISVTPFSSYGSP